MVSQENEEMLVTWLLILYPHPDMAVNDPRKRARGNGNPFISEATVWCVLL
jgi:hypothetical protein